MCYCCKDARVEATMSFAHTVSAKVCHSTCSPHFVFLVPAVMLTVLLSWCVHDQAATGWKCFTGNFTAALAVAATVTECNDCVP